MTDDRQCEYTLLHYLVSLPFEVFTPSAIAAGIEAWTWVIAEKPGTEVVLISEILAAWFATVRDRRGVFSQSLKSEFLSRYLRDSCIDYVNHSYDDPLCDAIGYSPTDKEEIDRATSHARRLLLPHTLVLQMLFSRLQAARYRRSTVIFLMQQIVLRSTYAYKMFRWVKDQNMLNLSLTLLQYTSARPRITIFLPFVWFRDIEELESGYFF